jgi:hypothetical protein
MFRGLNSFWFYDAELTQTGPSCEGLTNKASLSIPGPLDEKDNLIDKKTVEKKKKHRGGICAPL